MVYIISLPLTIDNYLVARVGRHPLRDVESEHLRGTVYLVSLEESQIQNFESRLNRLRWLNVTDWFQPLVLFRFETKEMAYEFLKEKLFLG